jgi:hypothetical protein
MNRPVGSQYGNDKGRPYGVIVPTKHYNSLPYMLQQLEDERVRRGWSGERLDMEAGLCVGTYRNTVKEGRAARYTTLVAFARAFGMEWKLSRTERS